MKTNQFFLLFNFIFFITTSHSLFSRPLAQIETVSMDSTDVDTVPVFSASSQAVVIRASRLRNPFPVSAIRSDEIELADAPTIEPLLNRLPGIWMQTGALNTNRISIRGVGYQEPFATTGIKIYLDDIPLTNGAGESSIEDIHPFILSGMDVWRGPASALWGAGLGGMIQLKTKTNTSPTWHTKFQIGSYDRLEVDQGLTFEYGKQKQWSTTLFYQYLHDGGYRQNNDYKKHSFTWMQRWRPHEKMVVTSFLHGIDLKAFLPSSIIKTLYDQSPELAAPQWIGVQANEDYRKWISGINLTWMLKSDLAYKATVFANMFRSDEVRPFNVLDEGSLSYGTRHHLSYAFAPWGHLNLGMEYFRERADFSTFQTLEGGMPGDQLTDVYEIRSNINGFIQTEFDINDQWIIFTGVHVNNSSLSGYSQEEKFPATFFPTVGSNFLIADNIALSGSVSRGYSNVALSNLLGSSGFISPGIRLEKGWSEEAAITVGNVMDRYIRLGIYHLNMDNAIITQFLGDGTFVKVNAGNVVNQGIEAEYKYSFFKTQLSLQGAYTYQRNRNATTPEKIRLPGYPSHKLFHEFVYAVSKWRGSVTHTYVSKVFLDNQLTQAGDGYQVVNLNLSYVFGFTPDWTFRIMGSLQNVFDSKYASMYQINAVSSNGALPRYYYPGKPRSFYLGITMDHNFH